MENTADTVAESCVGGFVIMERRREQHPFPSERMKFGLDLWYF